MLQFSDRDGSGGVLGLLLVLSVLTGRDVNELLGVEVPLSPTVLLVTRPTLGAHQCGDHGQYLVLVPAAHHPHQCQHHHHGHCHNDQGGHTGVRVNIGHVRGHVSIDTRAHVGV